MPTKAWLMDSETDSSFQWLSKQEQGFQVDCSLDFSSEIYSLSLVSTIQFIVTES